MPFPSPAGAAASVSSRIGPCRKNSGPNEREPRRIVRRAEDRPARAVATVAYRMPPQKTAHTPSVWSRRKTLLKIPPDKVYKAKSRITDNRASRRVVHATAAIHGRYARRADRSERLTDDRRFSRDGTASVARVNSGVPRITGHGRKALSGTGRSSGRPKDTARQKAPQHICRKRCGTPGLAVPKDSPYTAGDIRLSDRILLATKIGTG